MGFFASLLGCASSKAIEVDVQGALRIANSLAETALTNFMAWKQIVPVYKNALRRWMPADEAEDLVSRIDKAVEDNKGSLLMGLTSLSPADESNFLRCCGNYLYPNDPSSQRNWAAIGRSLLAVSRAVVVRAQFLTKDETKNTKGLKSVVSACKKAKTVDAMLEKLPRKPDTYNAIDFIVKSNNRRKSDLTIYMQEEAKAAAERKPSIVAKAAALPVKAVTLPVKAAIAVPMVAAKAVGGAAKTVGEGLRKAGSAMHLKKVEEEEKKVQVEEEENKEE